MEYIISQIFVIFSYAALISTYFFKNRKFILLFSCFALICNGFAYFFLGAWSGLAMCGFAIIRNIVFMIQNKFFKTDKITWIDWIILAVLLIVSAIFAVITYDGFLSLLSVFGTLVYTISVWQKNTTTYKILGIVSSILWVAYGIFIKSIFSIVLETVLLTSEIIGTIKALKNKNIIQE